MNKYEQFNKSGCRDMTAFLALRNIEREEMEAARMHKPGYRRKMRHTNNKHTKSNSYTSH